MFTNKNPQLTQSDREIMTAPYSICHPCPMAALALPELEHCRKQGTSAPSVPPPSPRHCTSTRSSQCPVGLYLPALFALDPKTHAHTRTNTGTPTSTPTQATGNEAHMHICTRTVRALTYETVGAAPRWTREQWRSATKASKRRPSTRCKRNAKAKAKGKLPLIWPPCDSFE